MRRPGSGAAGPASTSGSDRGEALAGGPGPAGGAGGAAARGKGRGDKKPAAGSMRAARRSAGPSWFSVPPGPGCAWRCLVSLRCERARGSPAFLSMNACPLPGVSSSRAPPLSWQAGLEKPCPLLGPRHLKNPPPCPDVLQGHSSRSGLKGAAAALVSPTGARLLIFFLSATPSTW